jgi:hypothetical protein
MPLSSMIYKDLLSLGAPPFFGWNILTDPTYVITPIVSTVRDYSKSLISSMPTKQNPYYLIFSSSSTSYISEFLSKIIQ